MDAVQQLMTIEEKQIVSKTLLGVMGIEIALVILFNVGNQFARQSKHPDISPELVRQMPQPALPIESVQPRIPLRLIIPAIQVDTSIESVGINSQGEMESPSHDQGVGWFNYGPKPGEYGSAVLAGHLDEEKSQAGIFLNLSELRLGDKVYVEDVHGRTTAFVVSEVHTYDVGYVEDVFGRGGGAHLNLITCAGVWDPDKQNFSKRLVVFTDLVQ